MFSNLDLNPQFSRALQLMEAGERHLFITGRAGTGKSTLLSYFRSITKRKIAVVAPTGVAAVNISGQTIHSFFGFRTDVTVEKVRREAKRNADPVYRNLEALVIDEISMMRADLFDCVDQFLRINGKNPGLPFGGIQLILIGDLYQIPPVVVGREREIFKDYYTSEYFFASRAYSEIEIEHLELEKVYRQTDGDFIDLLNKIRNKTAGAPEIALLNDRVAGDAATLPKDAIYLTTTNAMADDRNRAEMAKLPAPLHHFEAKVSGKIDEKSFPADKTLELKEGARVMLLNNDSAGRWINGTLGKVVAINKESLTVKLTGGAVEEVKPFKWNLFRFFWDEKSRAIAADEVGSFKQYPLKPAWAVTIHKSQGKTFDSVVIDLGRGAFATGQLYVALSRCRSYQGIYLSRPVRESDILVDYRVMNFMTGRQYAHSEEKLPLDDKVGILSEAAESGDELQIIYLKNTDEKSCRLIRPESVGMMEYRGRQFLGMRAYCLKRKEMRTFRVDRILEISRGDNVFEAETTAPQRDPFAGLSGIAGCIDVETTGLSPHGDEIVELALVLFSYDEEGITGLVDSYCGLREPGGPISRGAQRVHGLSKADLAGERLDTQRIQTLLGQVDFLVAHNASFDRGFVIKAFPAAKTKRWYCSMSGIGWRGRGGRSLQALLSRHNIEVEEAHRALDDVHGVLALLSCHNGSGRTYFAELFSKGPIL